MITSRSSQLIRQTAGRAFITLTLLLGALGFFTPGAAAQGRAPGWQIECVDCPHGFDRMSDRSLRLDANGYPHIAYGERSLYYAWYDGANWHVDVVDDERAVGGYELGTYAALDLDSAGNPHISYFANDAYRYAYKDGTDWQIETFDATWSQYGSNTSIAVDSNDYPHIAYLSTSADKLRYAYKDAGGWHIQDVTTISSNYSNPSLALDSLDHPHISYDHGSLQYAHHNGTSWSIETAFNSTFVKDSSITIDGDDYPHIAFDETGLYYTYKDAGGWHSEAVPGASADSWRASIGLDGSGYPHISYYNATVTLSNLDYAYKDSGGWHIETVDTSGEAGQYNSIVVEGGYPHIAYLIGDLELLKYAAKDGAGWTLETVDQGGNAGQYPDIALDSAGHPHISYLDGANGDLRYATFDGTNWIKETVDSSNTTGLYTSIALDGNDYPHISYYDAFYDDLKYAYWDGAAWQIETVDSSNDVGQYSSLALDSNDDPHIAYYGGGLKYAHWYSDSWQIETVGSGGLGSSLALDSNDNPHIGYYNGNLKYAYWDGAAWQIETVDDMSNAEPYIALALDDNDHPHLSYHYNPAAFADYVRYAHHDGSGWVMDTVDTTDTFPHNDIAVDGKNQPHFSYVHSDSLWYAYAEGIGINHQLVDDQMGYNGQYQGYNALALDGDNLAHIAYYSDEAEGLKYAVRLPSPPLPPPPACSRYVDLAGTCNSLAPCYTGLGLAVAAAIPGDGICIFPGTYAESLDLSTMGTPGDLGLATLNASGTPTPGTATVNPSTGPAIYNSVDPFPGNLYMDGLNLTSPDEDGLEIAVEQHIILQNLTASDNFDDGFDIYQVQGNVVMTDCMALNNGDMGIAVWAAVGNVTITGAETNGNADSGIWAGETQGHVAISDCTANGNGDDAFADGIHIEDTGGSVRIERCTANGNNGSLDNDGVEVNAIGGNLLVRQVTAIGNAEDGFDLRDIGGSTTVEAIVSQDHSTDGVWLEGSGLSPAVNGSILCEDGTGVSLGYAITVDAEGNWWGCAAGPGNPGCTIAEELQGTIDYDPWIDTISATATVDPVDAGQPTVIRFQFSGGGATAFLGQGPGDPNGTPPFRLTTNNGTLTGAGETRATVYEFVNQPDGILEVTLIPTWGGTTTVTLDGPCGLDSSISVQAIGEIPQRFYLPLVLRRYGP